MYYSQASSSGVVEEREKRSISALIKVWETFHAAFGESGGVTRGKWEVEVVHLDVCWKVTITSTISLPYLVFTTITLSHTT